MKKFIVIYHAPADAWKQNEGMSKEDMAKGMEQWIVWAQKCGDKLVDMGSPLANGADLIPDGSSKQGDITVAGYSVLQAANMDEAKSLLQGHPHLAWNGACSISVFETMPTPGM